LYYFPRTVIDSFENLPHYPVHSYPHTLRATPTLLTYHIDPRRSTMDECIWLQYYSHAVIS